MMSVACNPAMASAFIALAQSASFFATFTAHRPVASDDADNYLRALTTYAASPDGFTSAIDVTRIEGANMTALWIVLAFWSGGCAGYVLFAAMQMADRTAETDALASFDAPTDMKFAAPTRRWT